MLKRVILGVAMISSATAAGCVVQDEPGTDKFIQAIPTADDVKLKEPVAAGSATTTQSFDLPLGAQDVPGSSYATYYKFTRQIFDGVNLGTGYILGSVWLIVHYPATSVSDTEAVWGPWSEALSPAEYRFRATEIGTDEYEYALEARAKGTTGDFQAILTGHGYGEAHAKHREGSFLIDYDKANELDPSRLHADDESGTLNVDFNLSQLPTTINVTSAKTMDGSSFNVVSTTEKAGGGVVRVSSHDDIDDSQSTAMEDVTMNSRWIATGAGRADVTVQSGDVPAGFQIKASECWSSTFERTYWTDNASMEPAQGDVAQCPYADAEY